MRYFYFVGPMGSDPQFSDKRRILERVSIAHDLSVQFPAIGGVARSMEEIAAQMRNALFVIADLSHERPSCYFEVGIAAAAGANVRLIAQGGTKIHQIDCSRSLAFYSDLNEYERLVSDSCALGVSLVK